MRYIMKIIENVKSPKCARLRRRFNGWQSQRPKKKTTKANYNDNNRDK